MPESVPLKTNASSTRIAAFCTTLLLIAGLAPPAFGVGVVVPNALATEEGGVANIWPFSCSFGGRSNQRYQQVYRGTEVGSGWITELAFRQDTVFGAAFPPTVLENVTITLSSTAAQPDGLSEVFSSNIGSDVMTVFSADLTLESAFSDATPRPFDIVIPLQGHFSFDSGSGNNLLLDVTIPDCAGTAYFDAEQEPGDGVSRLFGPVDSPTGSLHTLGLVTRFVLENPVCGNGLVESGEQCDDGNLEVGDCCDSACEAEFAGSPCPPDGNVCTSDVCDGLGSCGVFNTDPCDDSDVCTQGDACDGLGSCVGGPPLTCDDNNACTGDHCDPLRGCVHLDAPASACLGADESTLLIEDPEPDHRSDRLLWRWKRGHALTQLQLADPTSSDNYTLCVYAGTAETLVGRTTLPAGGSWNAVGRRGYTFKGADQQGRTIARIKAAPANRSSAVVKGDGPGLSPRALPLSYPVRVQLRKGDSALCLESSFAASDEVVSNETRLKVRNR